MFSLEVSNLTKTYKKKTVLDSISFSVEENKTAVFLGLDDSGKTTLAKVLSLIIKPNSGVIKYNEREIADYFEPFNLVSIMPSEEGLSEHLTVFENLRLMARTRDLSEKDAISLINELALKYDIKDRFDDKVLTLSKSLKKLVSFIMCIVSGANVLVLDEPFKDSDIKMQKLLLKYIKELKGTKTIIITTEIPSIALDLADDLYILNNGKIEMYSNEIELEELENILLNAEVK